MSDDFARRLMNSHAAVLAAARLLRKYYPEYKVIVPEPVASKYEDRYDNQDNGDIFLVNEVSRWRWEVKQTSRIFSDKIPWPFPRVFIDESYKLQREGLDPLHGFIVVSGDLKWCMVIPVTTKPLWYEITKFDRTQGRECLFTCISPSACTLMEIPHEPTERTEGDEGPPEEDHGTREAP